MRELSLGAACSSTKGTRKGVAQSPTRLERMGTDAISRQRGAE